MKCDIDSLLDHYEYSPHYADFGKNEGDDGFFPAIRLSWFLNCIALKPGRVAVFTEGPHSVWQ